METFWIWVGFGLGLFVRWGDRIQHVVSGDAEHTFVGYMKANYVRLIVRLVSNASLFYYTIFPTFPAGWEMAPFLAFTTGVSFDTLAESALDRAKKQGEALVNKIKNGGGA